MTKTINVEGMMCPKCEARVVNALTAVDGVSSASANHESGIVTVELSQDVPFDTLKGAIEAQDYKVIGAA